MIAIARCDNQYLLVEEEGAEQGQILDTDQKKLFPLIAVISILARGYWEAFDLDTAGVAKLLSGVSRVDSSND